MDISHILWCALQFLGPALVESSYIPQIVRLYRIKHAEEISVLWPSLNLAGRAVNIVITWYAGLTFFSMAVVFGLILRASFFTQVLYYRWRVRRLARLQSEEIAI